MNPTQRTSASAPVGRPPTTRARQAGTTIPARRTDEPWYQIGACKDVDPELFFPDGSTNAAVPRTICNSKCTVREECLKYALENDERFGIWGGLSARQRNKIKAGTTTRQSQQSPGPRPRLAAVAEESPEQAAHVTEGAHGAA
ncbi:WhiB family transcriptional regulator [Arthrobacter bambusae]|uniref:Transcriptional regulator WhiB n=1 Tax=Arthrobacter bambusae TaxID=1338426 RepID=A0AAW8DB33_9MICC|nr:hypothetical protein [Arthrobacter bambusae]MDQ0128865.1 hypothetical protein [Arthrobacter bambusae]MDQ0180206.1 hypothetical protein [Arthrobacter bambusae]